VNPEGLTEEAGSAITPHIFSLSEARADGDAARPASLHPRCGNGAQIFAWEKRESLAQARAATHKQNKTPLVGLKAECASIRRPLKTKNNPPPPPKPYAPPGRRWRGTRSQLPPDKGLSRHTSSSWATNDPTRKAESAAKKAAFALWYDAP